MISTEKTRAVWRQINSAKARLAPARRQLMAVEVEVNGVIHKYDSRPDMELAIMENLDKRFRLTEGSPLCTENHLSTSLGQMGITDVSQSVLDGTFVPPATLDSHSADILKLIGEVATDLRTRTISSRITTSDFISFWKHCKETTSSSASGLHFGHYKAAADSPCLASLHSKLIELSFQNSQPLDRWSVGLSVMLEKEHGNLLVKKLRAILLMEADLNFANKLYFGKRLANKMDRSFLPPETFARKNQRSSDVVVTRALYFDSLRIRRWTGALGSYDAENCYDRVTHSLASLMTQALGTPAALSKCMFQTIQDMKFHLRTGYGDSASTFGSNFQGGTSSYQGLVQGNGAAPALWLLISGFLVKYLRQQGHGTTLVSSISKALLRYCALLYVDDGDFPTPSLSASESLDSVISRHQSLVNDWSGGLFTSGGALKAAKSFWYPIFWTWTNGYPSYGKAKHCRRDIYINNGVTDQCTVPLLDCSIAKEILGVWQAPNGSQKAQLSKLDNLISDYVGLLQNGFLSRKNTWTSFWRALWQSMRYPLVGMSPTVHECNDLMKPLYKVLLPKIGVVFNLPLAYRFSSSQYLGLGLPCVALEHVIEKLTFLTTHLFSPSLAGKQLLHTLEDHQFEIGSGTFFLQLTLPLVEYL